MKKIDQKILLCPNCKAGSLLFEDNQIFCPECKNKFEYKNNKIIFLKLNKTDINDLLDRIKFRLKKFSFLYNFLIILVSPVCPTINLKKLIKKYVNDNKIKAINLGSGNSKLSDKILNIDIFSYDNVDIVCDIENLPFKNNSIDVVFNIAVLEHVKNPEKVVDEIHRILKNDGVVVSFFPFIQPFHASPYDFSRRTFEGMKILYKDFDNIDLKSAGGPTSGFLWIFQEWLSILLSFGIKPLYYLINLLLMLITFPVKFLDLLLIYHPMAKNISSGFLFIGRKR